MDNGTLCGQRVGNEPNRLERNSTLIKKSLSRYTLYIQPVLVLLFRPVLNVFLNYCPTKASPSARVCTYTDGLMMEVGGLGGARQNLAVGI